MQNIKEIISRIIILIAIFAALMILLYLFEQSPMGRKIIHSNSNNQTTATVSTVKYLPDSPTNATIIKFMYQNLNYFKANSNET